MSGVGIYAKNWTKYMGVRTDPRPQERVQKPFTPLCGGGLALKKFHKDIF
jgi:hypothetical protein